MIASHCTDQYRIISNQYLVDHDWPPLYFIEEVTVSIALYSPKTFRTLSTKSLKETQFDE